MRRHPLSPHSPGRVRSGFAWALAACLALPLAAFPPGVLAGAEDAPPAAEAPQPPAQLELSADVIEQSLEAGFVTATGAVTVRLPELTAEGATLSADLNRHTVAMPGPVTLITATGVLHGENLQYAWDARKGSLERVETVNQGIRLSGRQAEVSPTEWLLHDGLYTKCLLPTPEYAFLARDLRVDPETRVATARGVTLALFGHRLLPLPNLRFSLKDTPVGRMSRERLPVPSTGYDSARGYYVAEEVPVHLSDQAILLGGAGYGTKEGGRLTLSGLYTPTDTTTISLDARWIQRDAGSGTPSGQPAPDLDGQAALSTSGYLGRLVLQAEDRDDDNGKDLAFLPRIAWTPPAIRLAGLTLTPAAEWAQIREAATGVQTQRQNGSLAWATPSFTLPAPAFLPGGARLSASGTLGAARYGTGDGLTTETLVATLRQPLTQAFALTAAYNRASYTGETPFAFDQPDRYTEGELGLGWRTGGNTLSFSAVYDLASTPGQPGPALNRPAALKGSASLTAGRWSLSSAARYELGDDPHYSELSLTLLRRLHCFDVSLKAEPLDQKFSVGVALR